MSDDNNLRHLPVGPSPEGRAVFDMPRPDIGFDGDGERHVQFETNVTMRVDATDQYIAVPVRGVFVSDGLSGWLLELGPYSIEGPDACALANALERYGKLSGDFTRREQRQ